VPYTVVRESQWIPEDATAGACDAPATAQPAYLRVNVSVTWPNMTGVKPVVSHTVVTPPVGTYDPSSGHIGVSVVDRDGAPASGIQILIVGPESQSQTTTTDGCAFFAFLPAGAYTVTASAAGYVSDQGVAAPQQTASVLVGATTSLLFLYDRAATLDLSLVGKDAGSPAPSDVPLVLANSHLLPAGQQLVPGSGSPRAIAGLFPWLDGYQVWAGSCADADPQAHAGGSRGAPVGTVAGGTTAGTVLMPEIRVVVEHDIGGGTMAPVPGQPVQAVHAADASCTAGETYSVGSTDAAGELVFALPYGTWDILVGAVLVGSLTLTPTDPAGPVSIQVLQ
jgi:hypothetical protein